MKINRFGSKGQVKNFKEMIFIDKFENLPNEKKMKILQSAMENFGNFGYKKASISDIANASDTSKSMIFYYFGNKKNLYCYLVDLSYKEVINALDENQVFKINNFFDRIEYIVIKKMEALQKYPGVMKFLTSFYFEEDKEIAEFKKVTLEKSEGVRDYFLMTEVDEKIFKDTVDPKLFLKIFYRWNTGLVESLKYTKEDNFTQITVEAIETIKMMKLNFCKEEYL